MAEPGRISGQSGQDAEEPSRAGGAVAHAEVEARRLLLLGVAHQGTVADGLHRRDERMTGGDGRVTEPLQPRRVGEQREEVPHACAAVGMVGGGERERHVGHEPPAQAVGTTLRDLEQAIPDAHGDVGRVVEQHEPCAGTTDRQVVDLTLAREPRDVGERSGLDPADARADLDGLSHEPVTRMGRRGCVSRVAGAPVQLVERQREAAPAGAEPDRRALPRHDPRGELRAGLLGTSTVRVVPREVCELEQEQHDAGRTVVEGVRDGGARLVELMPHRPLALPLDEARCIDGERRGGDGVHSPDRTASCPGARRSPRGLRSVVSAAWRGCPGTSRSRAERPRRGRPVPRRDGLLPRSRAARFGPASAPAP